MAYGAASLQRARTTNATDTSFAAKIATATKPSGAGVLEVQGRATAEIMPFGAGNDDQTFDMRIIGWRNIGDTYVPTIICAVSCTLCTATGYAGGQIVDTDRLVDTITVNSGVAVAPSVAANTPGLLLIAVDGFELIEAIFDMTGATNGNCLVGMY